MNFLHAWGEALIQQHEGDRQVACALVRGVRALARRVGRLVGAALSHRPGEHSLP